MLPPVLRIESVRKGKADQNQVQSAKRLPKSLFFKHPSARGASGEKSDAVVLQAKVNQFLTATPQTVLER
jgi:hypothetical protein